MKKITASLITFSVALALTCPVFAGAEESGGMQSEQQQSDQMQMSQGQIPSAEELKGMKVVNQNGEEIGEITEANQSIETGQVNYVTIAKGGTLGMGEENIPAPVEALSFDSQQQQATLQVDESKLENVPEQAGMDEQSFERELESHYGVAPAFQDEQQQEPQMQEDMQQEQEMQQMDQPQDGGMME